MSWSTLGMDMQISDQLGKLLKVLMGIEKDLDTMNIELGNIRHIMQKKEEK